MSNSLLAFAALAGIASWLAPNHYLPWLSFHAEVAMVAAFALAFFAELVRSDTKTYRLSGLAVAVLALSAVPLLQAVAGRIHFAGDAVLAFGYLVALGLSIILGTSLVTRLGADAVFERLSWAFVAAATLSVGVQLYQWLRIDGLGIFAAELPDFARPFANVAQPNHLATMLFLGLVGVLFLYERRKLRGSVACLAALFLEFGISMTGSRTAWLAMAVLAAWLLWARAKAGLRLPVRAIILLAGGFVLFVVVWGPLCEALILASGRTMANQSQAGPRPMMWASMLDAISREPWFGYGWNQALVAHSRVVDAHPAAGRLIGHSHNLMLDLMVWNGIPLGLTLIGLLAWWFWKHGRACRSPFQACLLAALAGVFLHALVEYPLSYMYFLLPVGLMMGMLDSVPLSRVRFGAPRWSMLLAASGSTALAVLITVEYVQIEANMRILQFELARIGTGTIQSKAPELTLMTHTREYLRFARFDAHAGMSPDRLAWMGKVAERFPFAKAQLNYAVANALNGRPEIAREVLARLCHMHTPRRCNDSLRAWRELAQSRYPQLSGISGPPLP